MTAVKYNFIDGPFIKIEDGAGPYEVSFIDMTNNTIAYKTELSAGGWAHGTIKYYVPWMIKLMNMFNGQIEWYTNNLIDKDVHVYLKSYSLGDTIAWMPYVELFRRKHQCNVFCSTNWNRILRGAYPNIVFIKHSEVPGDAFARYNVDIWHLPVYWRTVSVQQYAALALGVDSAEVRAKVDESIIYTSGPKSKYVCIAEHSSTSSTKQWHYPNGWQIIVDYLMQQGYKIISVAKEGTNLNGVIDASGNNIEVTMGLLKDCEFFIGLASGLSWLAWALGKKVVMISGFSAPWCEFKEDNYRVVGQGDCVGCYNDISIINGDSRPCPNNLQCSRLITPDSVIEQIYKLQFDNACITTDLID